MRQIVRTLELIALVLLLDLSTHGVQASDRSMRCGGDLIYAGGGSDSTAMYEVLKKCGQPVEKKGNTWIYIQGTVRRELSFNHQGRLQRIHSFR